MIGSYGGGVTIKYISVHSMQNLQVNLPAQCSVYIYLKTDSDKN